MRVVCSEGTSRLRETRVEASVLGSLYSIFRHAKMIFYFRPFLHRCVSTALFCKLARKRTRTRQIPAHQTPSTDRRPLSFVSWRIGNEKL